MEGVGILYLPGQNFVLCVLQVLELWECGVGVCSNNSGNDKGR